MYRRDHNLLPDILKPINAYSLSFTKLLEDEPDNNETADEFLSSFNGCNVICN